MGVAGKRGLFPIILLASKAFFSGVSLLTIILLMMSTAGCVPATHSFFRPSAPGGTLIRGHCPPVHSVILLERSGVIVAIRVSESSSHTARVLLSFEVPQGRIVRLKERTVELSVPGQGAYQGELDGWVWESRYESHAFPVDNPMTGKTRQSGSDTVTGYGSGGTPHLFYTFRATFKAKVPMLDSDVFTLKLPRFLVNDADIELPVIDFRRTSEFLIASFNC